ncbi:hypothetical protein [Lactococcus ileimucosae]|uniref:hypothetical protein n=1 Tax=Lactococcus ileimucosae TaxID=2941329 RepID=UPI002044C463|nr:hypothetical protein [Lactococcus ileimucosae]
MIIFIVILLLGLFFWGLIGLVEYFVNKKQVIEKLDKSILQNERERERDWSPIELIAVKETSYYSIIKTLDEQYFLVKHLPVRNVFKKTSNWRGYKINVEFVEKIRDFKPKDFSLITFLGGLSGVFIFVRHFATEKDLWWFTDLGMLLLYLVVIVLGCIVGYKRVRRSIANFEKKYQISQQNFDILDLKIRSHQILLPIFSVIVLIATSFIPLPFWFRVAFVVVISEELIPRLISTIGKEKKQKLESFVSGIQKYLYGEDASWTDIGVPSEINNDYRREK